MDNLNLNYDKLQTTNFINKINYNNNINSKFLKNLLKECYENVAFSTLPYFIDHFNSINSITKLNSGNCVSMSMYLKIKLAENGIKSYLIPASIPFMYKKPEYLYISHVALAIPKNKNQIYILDPAFYFFTPILYDMNDINKPQLIDNINIYNNDKTNIISTNHIMTRREIFNKYQSMPKYTFYTKCRFVNNLNDTWNYYLREIKNPDKAISTYFINCNKRFITTTKFKNDGYCYMDIYLKIDKDFMNNDILTVTVDNKPFFKGYPQNLTSQQVEFLNKKLGKFINKNIKRYLYNKIKKKYKIID